MPCFVWHESHNEITKPGTKSSLRSTAAQIISHTSLLNLKIYIVIWVVHDVHMYVYEYMWYMCTH